MIGKSYTYMKFCCLFVLCFVFFLAASAQVKAEQQARGLWVECEGSNETLSSPGKLQQLIQIAKDSGVNTIFLQVYRHDRSWYDSGIADTTPFDVIWGKYKIDPLAYTISYAHKNGIKVHAWINMFRIGKELDTPILKKLGKDVITRDGAGKSIINYSENKLPDNCLWVDPGDPAVKEYLLKIIGELLQKYPQLDGIHLDYIRYPYSDPNPGSRFSDRKDFGYNKSSVDRFKLKYGYSPLGMDLTDRDKTQEWDDWRRQQVTDFVGAAYTLVKKVNPQLRVSCAVQAQADRAYLTAYQDWRNWLKSGVVDFVVLMNYSIDRTIVKYAAENAMTKQYSRPAYMGLGAYLLLKSPVKLYLQIADCQELKAEGIVLFSYDAILKNKKIFKDIAKNKWWAK